MDSKENLKEIVDAINTYKTFAIYSHINTDFDALCSSLALKRVLEKHGKTAHVFSPSGFPDNVNILDGHEKINSEKLKSYDVAVILDCGDLKRIGKYVYKYRKNTKTTISIDHHIGTPVYTKLHYLVPGASSTCEILCDLFDEMNEELDPTICKLLISGIYTDTGSLCQSNTHVSTFKLVAKLFEKTNVSMDTLTEPIFKSLSLQAYKLKKFAYNKLELACDNKVAICVITADDFERLGAAFEDTEGLVDVGSQINTVQVNALLSEDPKERGAFRVSVRSKGEYCARNVAMAFGGGGHNQAAGCKIYDTPENAKKRMLIELEKEINRL